MKHRIARAVAMVALSAALLPGVLVTPAHAAQDVTTIEVPGGEFDTVAQDLNDAIVNKGFVIDYHGFIGDMLKRTAADVGSSTALYEDAEFFTFCSAVVSRRVMEADAGNIAYCPYVLFVYREAGEGAAVKVGFRRLPEGGGRDEVNAVLEEIARAAAGDF